MSALSALVGGGADCGPSNPLSQLSKQFGNDRGVQQDHFGASSSSQQSFRQQGGSSAGGQDEMNRFYNSQRAPSPRHAFDLSPMHRALTPPAWAQAFVQTELQEHRQQIGNEGGESAAFRRAFNGPPNLQQSLVRSDQSIGNEAWSGQFESGRLSSAVARGSQSQSRGRVDHQSQQQRGGNYSYQNPVDQARLYGQGFGQSNLSGMMRVDSRGAEGAESYGQAFVSAAQDSQWETAFLAQEHSTSPLLSQAQLDTISTAPPRARSPELSATQTRDALAITAGQLLDTVQSSEQSHRTASGVQMDDDSTRQSSTRNDKFANSTFLDLMRKLRDGEVAVEGDKVVEQVGEHRSSIVQDKGKGREGSSWANDFTREEEGRVGAASKPHSAMDMDPMAALGRFGGAAGPMGMGMGMGSVGGSSLEAFNRTQAERKAASDRHRQVEASFDDMREVWEDEDKQRAARENRNGVFGVTREGRFQGDGGAIQQGREEDIEMMSTNVLGANANWEEDFGAETIVGGHSKEPRAAPSQQLSAQEREWDLLQNDWETFEATATGIKASEGALDSAMLLDSTTATVDGATASTSAQGTAAAAGYSFASSNPYFASTRTHSLHTLPATRSTYESVLEREAAVLQNPTDSHAWLALGIKQQENEREEQAILALTRALQLDPDLREAYLALAVSYTNENERVLAYDAIDRWIDCLSVREYSREISNYRDLFGKLSPKFQISEKHDYLTGLLIRLAQSRAVKDGADVDADVQIGLGVLFNTSEEYDKAGDCFESALSVRPDDPLLFNRLGATLANGGKAELAIQYYLEAIEIQPSYVRARFNLAVANMNLNQHQSAAEHLITALSIQESDSQQHPQGGDRGVKSGVTSQALWDSLNIALLMMHRNDLATMCTERDLTSLKRALPVAEIF